MLPAVSSRYLVASDASQEVRTGSAGAVFLPGEGSGLGLIMQVKISQLYLFIVVQTLGYMAPVIQGQSGLWFVDNVAALMAFMRGSTH